MLNHSLTYGPLHYERQQQIVSDSTMQTYLIIVMFIIRAIIRVLVVVIWTRNQHIKQKATTARSSTANNAMCLDTKPRLHNSHCCPKGKSNSFNLNPIIINNPYGRTSSSSSSNSDNTPTRSQSTDNIITQRLLGPDGKNRLCISNETVSAIVTDTTPKIAKFDMGELQSHLEEDGECTAHEDPCPYRYIRLRLMLILVLNQ